MFSKEAVTCNDLDEVDLIVKGTCFHHNSWANGYVSRKVCAIVEPYSGKFGTGFRVHTPAFNSSKYHEVSYYLYEVKA